MRGNALIAPAQNRVNAVEAVDGGTPGAWLAFVAGRRRVVEVVAPRALHQVAADRRHVAKLRRRPGEDRLRQQRIPAHHAGVVGDVAVGDERAQPQSAAVERSNLGQRQVRDVDQSPRPLDVLLHQVDEVRPAGNELGTLDRSDLAHGVVHVGGSGVAETVHQRLPFALASSACSIAATIFG